MSRVTCVSAVSHTGHSLRGKRESPGAHAAAIAAPATGIVSDAQKKKTTQRLRFERFSAVTPTAL